MTAPETRFLRRHWETLLWVAMFCFLGWRMWPQVAAAFGVASAHPDTPAFRVTTLHGDTLSSQQLRGRIVLVNFWATWCPPCRIEMPGFQRTYDRFRDRGFVVLGVSTDAGGSQAVQQFVTERGITYPIAMASSSMVQDFGGVRLLPTSFLIDRQGRIRNEVRGFFASLTLEQAVQRLLDEAATDSMPPSPPR